jgi:hypothetical protein
LIGWRILACALAAGVAGCGASDADRLATWREQADEICARAERALRGQDPALDGPDMERLMVGVREEVHAAAEDLRDLEAPESARRRIGPFLDASDRVAKRVSTTEKAAESARRTERQAARLRLDGLDLEVAAREAGLRRCGRPGQADAAADAVQMPAYAAHVAEIVGSLREGAARVKRRVGAPEGPPAQRARYWLEMHPVVSRARYGFRKEAPVGIDDRAETLFDTLFNLEFEVDGLASLIAPEGELRITPAQVRGVERRAARLLARAQRQGVDLLAATGAPGRRLLDELRIPSVSSSQEPATSLARVSGGSAIAEEVGRR